MTAIKTIVCHVDGGMRDGAVLRMAGKLAQRFDARLEAVFANVPPYIPASMDGILTPQIIEAQQAIYRERAKGARSTVDAAAAEFKINATLVVLEGRPVESMLVRGRFADLAVVAQPSPDEADAATDYDLPADLIMSLGRPVLLVPYAGTFSDVGRRALIAWAGTRESARAVADALPLLAGGTADVLLVNPKGETAPIEAEIVAWLGRHGVTAKAHVAHTKEIDVSDVILSSASDLSADLIVMGGYGRSRLRELILGGTTHDILKHMTVPVVMSH